MNYIKQIFKFYDGRYFVQSYLVSLFMAFLHLLGREGRGVLFSIKCLPEIVFIILSTLLYPFAKATYLYVKELLMPSDVVFISSIVVIFFAKIFMAMILYVFAIPFGLINVLIILIKYKRANKLKDDIQWYE